MSLEKHLDEFKKRTALAEHRGGPGRNWVTKGQRGQCVMGRQEGDCHQQGKGKLWYLKSEGTNGLRGVQAQGWNKRAKNVLCNSVSNSHRKKPKTRKEEVKAEKKRILVPSLPKRRSE